MMPNCEHAWIISSWTVNTHSKTAKELLCQKCLCIIRYEEMVKLRCAPMFHVEHIIKSQLSDISESR